MLSVISNLRIVGRMAVRSLSSSYEVLYIIRDVPFFTQSQIDIGMYEKRADETLESISDYVSDIGEKLSAVS